MPSFSESSTSVPSAPSAPFDPSKSSLRVPFSPQAPFANWDPLHEEACEEMSLIMVHHFLEGTPLSREDADGELYALTAWETQHGYLEDTTAAETAKIAEEYYGYSSTVYSGHTVTAELLRSLLHQGHPVIIPAQGQQLGNPYFSGEGPPYHMLVLVGFDGDEFITNDPGTRRGEGYRYSEEILMNAIHDWTGEKETVKDGRKAVFVLTKR